MIYCSAFQVHSLIIIIIHYLLDFLSTLCIVSISAFYVYMVNRGSETQTYSLNEYVFCISII